MNRRSFRDGRLGPWSSHPAFLVTRSWRWVLMGLVPLVAGIAFLVFLWRFGAITILSIARNWETWLPGVLGLVVMGFSMSITAALLLRASTVAALQPKPGSVQHDRTLPIWSFVAGTAAVAGLAFLLTRAGFLGAVMSPDGVASVRLVGHLLGTLPIFVLLVYLEFASRPVDEWGRLGQKRVGAWQIAKRALAVLGILAGFVLPMMWIDRIVAALDAVAARAADPASHSIDTVVARVRQWLPGSDVSVDVDPAAGATVLEFLGDSQHLLSAAALLIPIGCMVFFVFTTALASVETSQAVEEPVDAADVARAQGYLFRLAGECWDPNGKSARPGASRWQAVRPKEAEGAGDEEADGKSSPPHEPPAWLAELKERAEASAGCELIWGTTRRADDAAFSEVSAREDLAHLFATAIDPGTGLSQRPTKDQVGALEQFDRLFDEFLQAEDREGQCVFPSIDLLVTGAPGSGRTTLLLASALHAVVLRGQSALILVPTQEKVELFVRRLRDVATRGGVGWHVSVGPIQNDDVRSWADPIEDLAGPKADARFRSPIGSMPDILVGTPQDYERHLIGADHHFSAVRRALLRMQVVFLEDLTSFSTEERRHLPFLIDKHRLVLASEHLPVQFMALAPVLSEQARDYLVERLFTQKSRVSCVHLRPPPRLAPWLVEVRSDQTGEAMDVLAAAGARLGIPTVLWRPGVPSAERRKMAARLGAGGAWPKVVGDLDELEPEDVAGCDLAVHRSTSEGQPTLALASRVAGEGAVIIRVASPASADVRLSSAGALPVLPAVGSETLFVPHLTSAVRFLAPNTPIPRDAFARCGLRQTGALRELPMRDARFSAAPGCRLVLDPPESLAEPVATARGQVWAWVSRDRDGDGADGGGRRASLPPRPVELLRPLERGQCLRGETRGEFVHLGQNAIEEHAIATWSTQQGESLDRMDLAYAPTLQHRHGPNPFFPIELRSTGTGIQVTGAPFKDRGLGESYLPVWDLRMALPEDVQIDLDQGGVAPDTARWAQIRDVRPGGVSVDCQFWVFGTYDEVGHVSPIADPLPIHYPTRLGVLLLGRQRLDGERTQKGRNEKTRQALAGVWETRRAQFPEDARDSRRLLPWTVLGLALSAGLRSALPGLSSYCRVAAFRCPADGVNDDRAFVFFIEPQGTHGTVAAVLQKLMLDADLLGSALDAALDALDRLDPEDHDTVGDLMVEAGCLVGGGWYDGSEVSRELLAADRRVARALLGTVAEDVRDARERAQRRRGPRG